MKGDKMKRIIIKQEKFNTNNGWGFGGAIGTITTYSDGCSKREGRVYFRHLPSQKFVKYFSADHGEITKTTFDNSWGTK